MVYGENVPDRDGRCAVSRDDYWGGLYAGPEDEGYDEEYDEEYGEDELVEEDEPENDPTCADYYKEMMLNADAERYAEGKVYDPLTHSYIDRSDADPGGDGYYSAEEELFDDELAMYYADRASFLDDMDRSSSDGWFYGDDDY